MIISKSIHGGQDVETTKVPFARWLDKGDVVNIYNGTLLSYKWRWNTAIGDTWDGVTRLENWAGQYGGSQDPEAHRAGLRGLAPPGNCCGLTPHLWSIYLFSSLQLPLQILTTHHPQTQTPARGLGSGSLCRVSQPQHICPVSGNRRPRGRKAKTKWIRVDMNGTAPVLREELVF